VKARLAVLGMGILDIIIGTLITFLWWDQRRKQSRRGR